MNSCPKADRRAEAMSLRRRRLDDQVVDDLHRAQQGEQLLVEALVGVQVLFTELA